MKVISFKHQASNSICNPESKTRSHQFVFQYWMELLQRFLASLTRLSELRVWQSRDRQGVIRWHAYDPATGYQVSRFSEAEMIRWIEERNFHH